MNMNEGEVRPEKIDEPEVTYERRDMSARAVFGFLIGLAIAGVIMQVVLWGLYKYLAQQDLQAEQSANPIMTSDKQLQPKGDPAVTFPAPRLQPDPVADLNKFRAREEEILNSYSWVDEKAGIVRIPIERAMQIVEEQGLPTRAQSPSSAQATNPAPSAALPASGIDRKPE